MMVDDGDLYDRRTPEEIRRFRRLIENQFSFVQEGGMTIHDDFKRAFKEIRENPRYGIQYPRYEGRVEMSINPSLDYLFQYPVDTVEAKADGSGFSIRFAGGSAPGAGACIGIEDTMTVPDLTGRSLITVVRSATTVRMIFGQVVKGEITEQVDIEVPNEDYFIIDPRFDGEAFYPARFVPEPPPGDSIRQEFEGRFADGPDAASEGVDGYDPAQESPSAPDA